MEIASNGKERVLFLSWEPNVSQFQYYSPSVERKDFHDKNKAKSLYTKTVFIPNSDMAVTGTNSGMILVWDRSLIIEGIGEQNEKRLIKIVTLDGRLENTPRINILTTAHDKYLVVGFSDGAIRFYDFYFKIIAWFEGLHLNSIKSISFSKTETRAASNEEPKFNKDANNKEKPDEPQEILKCSDFIAADDKAIVVMLQSTLFEEINPAKKKGYTIMSGFPNAITAFACHPQKSWIAIAGAPGGLLLWDYIQKAPVVHDY
jgi:hypothetical protein